MTSLFCNWSHVAITLYVCLNVTEKTNCTNASIAYHQEVIM